MFEKRRHRREWQEHRSPGAKSKLKAAFRRLTKEFKKEEADAQLSYIENLTPTGTKNSLWKDHRNLQTPTETVVNTLYICLNYCTNHKESLAQRTDL